MVAGFDRSTNDAFFEDIPTHPLHFSAVVPPVFDSNNFNGSRPFRIVPGTQLLDLPTVQVTGPRRSGRSDRNPSSRCLSRTSSVANVPCLTLPLERALAHPVSMQVVHLLTAPYPSFSSSLDLSAVFICALFLALLSTAVPFTLAIFNLRNVHADPAPQEIICAYVDPQLTTPGLKTLGNDAFLEVLKLIPIHLS
ncbi:hypothetical protein BDN70DRAFT_939498 [Pholiota conissans]|uniref:Uncharacterized protein n=1 Tax=Pholiota conissans TaxID=109636 RepID=A0A9P5YKP9_9AGAR|nr:hypothetical protein BDN70DRAFT_939498 [Pholiota conissans]